MDQINENIQEVLELLIQRNHLESVLNHSFVNQPVQRNPTDTHYVDELESIPVTQEMIETKELCSICQEPLQLSDSIFQLPCDHCFHDGSCSDCQGIKPWLLDQNTCPVCRYELPKKEEEETSTNGYITQEDSDEEGTQIPAIEIDLDEVIENQETFIHLPEIRLIQHVVLPYRDNIPAYPHTLQDFQSTVDEMNIELAIQRSLE